MFRGKGRLALGVATAVVVVIAGEAAAHGTVSQVLLLLGAALTLALARQGPRP